ncbi:MAG: ECF-type sigma factor [Acidobacteriota bacterium]
MGLPPAASSHESSRDSSALAAPALTQLLQRARGGNQEDLEILIATVYRELRRTAQSMLGQGWKEHSILATELVHEAFMRLFGDEPPDWENRRHFFGSAAIAMRRILIDLARKKRAGRRIPKKDLLPIEVADGLLESSRLDLVALDDALSELAAQNPRQAQVVELRFFAGLSESEVAELLDVSRMTVSRDWKVARLRLLRSMGP